MKIFVVPRVLEDPNDWRKLVVQVGEYHKNLQNGFGFIQGSKKKVMLDSEYSWFVSEEDALRHLCIISEVMQKEIIQLYKKWIFKEATLQATINFRKEEAARAKQILQQSVESAD